MARAMEGGPASRAADPSNPPVAADWPHPPSNTIIDPDATVAPQTRKPCPSRRRCFTATVGSKRRTKGLLRKRTGIEPAGPALTGGPTGFEDRAGHQPRTRFQDGLSQIAT